jgi:hypothetical protein
MTAIEIRHRTIPERLAWLAAKLREGDKYRESVAIALDVLAEELTEVQRGQSSLRPTGLACRETETGRFPGDGD